MTVHMPSRKRQILVPPSLPAAASARARRTNLDGSPVVELVFLPKNLLVSHSLRAAGTDLHMSSSSYSYSHSSGRPI